jgi:hypothetical protein
MVWASEDCVDKGASGRQVPNHALLHCREVRPAEQTTPYAGLVGDNDDGYACTIGGADYLRRPCDQPDFFRTPKMPRLLNDYTVSVKEQRWTRRSTIVPAQHFRPDTVAINSISFITE